jgi:hypothetical protein
MEKTPEPRKENDVKAMFKRVLGPIVLAGAAAFATAAAAEVPNLMHHNNGHEAVFKNGCVVAFRADGAYYENTEACSDKQIDSAKGLMVIYLAAHKGTKHSDTVRHAGASVDRLSDGSFEVTWADGSCFAQYNRYGEAMSYSSKCTDEQITKSSRLLRDFRRDNGFY